MLKPILVATFVAVVILTECIFAYMLIPSSADAENWAKTKDSPAAHPVAVAKAADSHGGHAPAGAKDAHGGHGGGHGAKTDKKAPAAHGSHGAHGSNHEHEVELGKFNVMIHQPAADVTLRINFHLIGTVEEKEEHEFAELLAKNQHRLRDHIISEIRNSETSDLTDPGLALIKRRILATSNALLGKPILRTIVFSDFSFIEQ